MPPEYDGSAGLSGACASNPDIMAAMLEVVLRSSAMQAGPQKADRSFRR